MSSAIREVTVVEGLTGLESRLSRDILGLAFLGLLLLRQKG